MKAVLLSIKPKYCELIASGKKTVEVRKTRPKLDMPFKVYIYMTKSNLTGNRRAYKDRMAGKVIGEFVCDDVAKVLNNICVFSIEGKSVAENNIIAHNSCLDFVDMKKYLGEKDGYAWHISNLVIYDKPKELSEFSSGSSVFTFDTNGKFAYTGLKRPPQSWCYVESEVQEDE